MRLDVIIVILGCFIDYMCNFVSFVVDIVEILVFDEVDCMLEDGFVDELNEILIMLLKLC